MTPTPYLDERTRVNILAEFAKRGGTVADYCYAILRAGWTPERVRLVREFLEIQTGTRRPE